MNDLHSFDSWCPGLLPGKQPGEAMPRFVLQLDLDGGSLSGLTRGLHVCSHAMAVISVRTPLMQVMKIPLQLV